MPRKHTKMSTFSTFSSIRIASVAWIKIKTLSLHASVFVAIATASTAPHAITVPPQSAPAPITAVVDFKGKSSELTATARSELSDRIGATQRYSGSAEVCASVATARSTATPTTEKLIRARETVVANYLISIGLPSEAVYMERRFGPRAERMWIRWSENPGKLTVVFFPCK